MSNSFIKGTLIITIATFLSKLLGSFFLIPLQNIAGDEVSGIFKLVYPVYMIALILSVAGIPIAISKLISEARAEKDNENISHIFKTASILTIGFGIISFTVMFLFSKAIAAALGSASIQFAIIIVSTTLLFAPYMAVYRGYFQGFEDMRPTALSQVLEQLVRVIITIGLAYVLVHKAASDITIASWIMVGSIAGVLISLLFLRIKFIQSNVCLKKSPYNVETFKQWAATILKTSLPIAVGALTMALIQLVDSFTIPHALKMYGAATNQIHELFNYYSGRGLSLVQMAVIFSSAIILPLIPLISKTVKQGKEEANRYIEQSLKFAHIISWPIAVGLTVLVLPINLTLFTDFSGSYVIAILGVSSLFTSYTVLTTGILQGLNKSTHVAVLLVIIAICKAILNFVLVAKMGISGAGWSTLIVYILLTIIHFVWIKKETRFNLKIKQLIFTAVASLIMGAAIASPLYVFQYELWTRINGLIFLVLTVPLGAILYFVVIFLLKVISKEDLASLPVIGRRFKRLSS